MPLQLLQTDITTLDVDAIVNAANETLLGGGGVDGAIHRAAGPRLMHACRGIDPVRPGVRCPTGEARVTPGFDLPARHVIHTVGPIWHGGDHGEAEALADCYCNSMREACRLKLTSIAFPAISCGVYGYPHDAAASVAVRTLRETAQWEHAPTRIVLCSFGDALHAALEKALRAI